MPPLALPPVGQLDASWCSQLARALEEATKLPAADFASAALSAADARRLLAACTRLLHAEPTLLHVAPPPGSSVIVVGDLHGQFHDLLTIFKQVGAPGDDRPFVFDGDWVDRGAWGLEIVLLLAAFKVAHRSRVALIRGNHETRYCSWVYGFRAEVLAKYPGSQGELVFADLQKLFAQLPLAAVVGGATLVLHGGLPRKPPRRATRRSLPLPEVAIASLDDIQAASKAGDDPDPEAPEQRLAADILWSDPQNAPGITLGARPGDVGILWGPDVTEAFLRDNGLRCILRGHEGPDARVLRPDMQPMSGGYTLDHDTPAGKLYTVFSAPNYPQFGLPRHNNQGAVAVLEGPRFDEPRFEQFEAVPRPQATPYYVESEDAEAELEAGAAAAGAGDGGHTMGSSSGSSSSEASSSDEEREDARGRESQDRAVARGVDATAPAPGGEEGLQGSDSSEAAAAAGEAEESQLVGQGAVVPLPPLCVEVPEPPALKRQKAEPVAAVAT